MPPAKRRPTSCTSCRRLRTRCEKLPGLNICHRCDRLRLRCSFPEGRAPSVPTSPAQALDYRPSISQPGAEIHQRLAAIDKAVAEIRALTNSTAQLHEDTPQSHAAAEQAPPLFQLEEDTSLYERTQAYARTAPISVVRDMETIITGNGLGVPPEKSIPDCVSQGLITENLCRTLFDSLRSLPLKRYGLDIDPWEIRTKSPVLFAALLLLGLLTIPALWDSKLHVELYTHARQLAEKVLLYSPLSLDTLRALLLFSIWDLVPHEKERYIDSWLMSGMGLVHGMLTIDATGSDDPNDTTHQASIDVWNALCLTHMQFVVGTGRPPVFGRSLLGDHVSDPQKYATGSYSQALVAQSQLYCILYDLVTSKSPGNATFADGDGAIEQWKEANRELIEADSSFGLAFAYSSAQLIHCRHTLKTLTDPTSDLSDLNLSIEDIEIHTEDLVSLSLDHSFEIMELYLKCATTDGMVRPAFASLMCSTAAITVVEFKEKLKSQSENFMLMEQLRSCSWGNRRTDGVVDWAANVIKTSFTDGTGTRGTMSQV